MSAESQPHGLMAPTLTPPKPTTLAGKLAAIMGDIGRIAKEGRNDFHKYDYVMEATVVEEIRGKLASYGVMLFQSVIKSTREAELDGRGKTTYTTTYKIRYTFQDGDTGEKVDCDWYGVGQDSADKGGYKAYTGALKYFLLKTFLVPTGDEPEETAADQRRDKDKKNTPAADRAQKQGGFVGNVSGERQPATQAELMAKFGALAKQAGDDDNAAKQQRLLQFLKQSPGVCPVDDAGVPTMKGVSAMQLGKIIGIYQALIDKMVSDTEF